MLEVASSHASPLPSSMQVASGDSLFSSPSSSTAIRTHRITAPMASPIWEEGPSTPYDDDDVPLSFSLSPSLSSSNASSSRYGGSGAGVRRSHTVTAAGSRLHRISSSGSGGSSSSAHPSSSTSASSIIDRPLSASTGVSRRTSLKAGAGAGSGLNRVMELEGSAEIEEDSHQPVAYQEVYPSNAYIPGDDDHDEDEALYPSAAASLARHSSMPVSRAFRRKDPSNPGAPWQRNHYNNAPTSPAADNSSTHVELHHRTRSNSTAAEARLPNGLTSPVAPSSYANHPTSPNAPTSPLNSGFVVTSRPTSQQYNTAPRTTALPAFASSIMSSSAGASNATSHGRSMSSHGWSSNTDGNNHSPTHSRHASDSLSGSGGMNSLNAPLQLGRVPSNASSTHKSSSNGHSNHNSSPSPASPIDSSLLGQNNPWSPTAEERMHFRELSGTLNLATLRSPPGVEQQQHHADGLVSAPTGAGIAGPISPPSSRRGSALKDAGANASPRRANSLNTHGRNIRSQNKLSAAVVDEQLPSLPQIPPSAATLAARQPQRRNTPVLPPLVTSSEALYNGAAENGNTANMQVAGHAGANVNPPQMLHHQQQMGQQQNGYTPSQLAGNGVPGNSKIIRGPASAAPYVPPIGHTHASDRSGISPETIMHKSSNRQGYDQSLHQSIPASTNGSINATGQATVNGLEYLNHMRGFTTAAPGIPESNYLQEKDRIAGNHQAPQQQQQAQYQQQQNQGQPLSAFSNPLSPHTATSLNSAKTMQFPSLNNANNAAVFTNNLQLQQQLLAQQTQALHEQQNQLALALASGLSLQERQATPGTNGTQPPIPLPTSPGSQIQSNFNAVDTYAIAAKIEALQKANALLASAMQDQNATLQQQQQQQGQQMAMHHFQQQQQQQLPHAMLSGQSGAFGQFGQQPAQRVQPPANGINGQAQIRHEGISPVDIHALTAAKGYNPRDFNCQPASARFFVIKSFTEDDVFKSIKFEIWSSTVLGNNRLDKAFADSAEKGPIYLFFSVNASGHFCGVAEMLTPLDYTVTSNVWAQGDKWKGVMKLRWIYIKDIPNPALRHLKLMNTNEQKPVTSSRDTQEVPYDQGCEMLRIFSGYQSKTSLLQDFAYYQAQTTSGTDAAQPPSSATQKVGPGYDHPPANPPVFTQAGHPNPYDANQLHRSATPLQQQQYIPQNQYRFPQQNRNRQAAPLKR